MVKSLKQNVFKRPFRNCPDGCEAGTNVWTYDCYGGANQQWDSSSLILQWNIIFAINISLLDHFKKYRHVYIDLLVDSSTNRYEYQNVTARLNSWKLKLRAMYKSILFDRTLIPRPVHPENDGAQKSKKITCVPGQRIKRAYYSCLEPSSLSLFEVSCPLSTKLTARPK